MSDTTETPETPKATPGRIVWHELNSRDFAQSVTFYSEFFGWRIVETEMGPGRMLHMIHNGEHVIGSMLPQDAGDPSPPHWIAFVEVEDIEDTVASAVALGGSAPVPSMEVPGAGRFAILKDPQGGLFAAWWGQGGGGGEDPEVPPLGTFGWNELVTTDAPAARAFYASLFEWQPIPMNPSAPDEYTLFVRKDERCEAAMMPIPADVQDPCSAWIPYVVVADTDEAVARAKELGAKLHLPPKDTPGGRIAVLQDPGGATFAVYAAPQA
jgi:predicted enzyme related to lactoylglutathione lyase